MNNTIRDFREWYQVKLWNVGGGGHQQPEKPLKSILAAGLPFMAYRHFFIPPEWYQSKPGSCETSSLVNRVVI